MLWSLANEFWYYLAFPCLWFACARSGRQWWERLLYALTAVAILVCTGRDISLYFSIWLMGTCLCLVPPLQILNQRRLGVAATAGSGSLLAVVLLLIGIGRLPDGYGTDATIAVSFSLLLYCVLHHREPASNQLYSRLSRTLSGFSYTLYIVHLPFLIFLRACLTYETAWLPDWKHWLYLGAILVGVVAYAYLVSRVTEARTDWVKRWLTRFLGPTASRRGTAV